MASIHAYVLCPSARVMRINQLRASTSLDRPKKTKLKVGIGMRMWRQILWLRSSMRWYKPIKRQRTTMRQIHTLRRCLSTYVRVHSLADPQPFSSSTRLVFQTPVNPSTVIISLRWNSISSRWSSKLLRVSIHTTASSMPSVGTVSPRPTALSGTCCGVRH